MTLTTSERYLFLDTETTGFSAESGDRLTEIGIIEVIDRKKTGRIFHEYVDPEREVPESAVAVHGFTREDLIAAGNGQKFADIAQRMVDFIDGGVLVIHNAKFDIGFLDAELRKVDMQPISEQCKVFDTLKLANSMYPGKRNNLDALCKRLYVDNSNRELHGALLDSEILFGVFLAMTRDQKNLELVKEKPVVLQNKTLHYKPLDLDGIDQLPVIKPSEAEKSEHEHVMKRVDKESGGMSIW